MSHLLSLPSELRAEIWRNAFANTTTTPQPPDNFYGNVCTSCQSIEHRPRAWRDVYSPLLTCRQIYREARDIFFSTLNLYLSDATMIHHIVVSRLSLLKRVQRVTLYLHLDEENRVDWTVALTGLLQGFSNLQHLTTHNHMRPPMSYENLVDGIFFAAPLVTVERPSKASHFDLHFDYIFEDVMFASPFLGEIKCSDALEEHELVIRDLLVDQEFATAAAERDLETMTGALLRIARSHEQPWFAKLQRRRLAELNRQNETSDGDSA